MKARQNIIFIAGIHGVGKTSICKEICSLLNAKYISASQVLEWSDLNITDPRNKKVQDINLTQKKLIQGLEALIEPNQVYVLDGHLCLFDNKENISKVPIETFQEINPLAIWVFTANPREISDRLYQRDHKAYKTDTLAKMQTEEVEYGKYLCNKLKIPFFSSEKIIAEHISALKLLTN